MMEKVYCCDCKGLKGRKCRIVLGREDTPIRRNVPLYPDGLQDSPELRNINNDCCCYKRKWWKVWR